MRCDAFRSDPFEHGLPRWCDRLLRGATLHGWPVEDELLDADLGVGADELIERLDGRERIRIGTQSKERPTNIPGVATELAAELIKTTRVFAGALDGVGQRMSWQPGSGLGLTA